MAGGSRRLVGLLERDGELGCIQQVISAVQQGHSGVLIVEGAAGIGKTALLRVLGEQAAAAGVETLTARCSELERDFGFGVVRQLLEARVIRAGESQRAELLAGAAGLAGPVLGLESGSVGDSFAALHGLYWLVANLAVGGPVVLAIDDLHWADEPSLRWLIYLCHRLEGLPVLMVASTRPPRPGHSPVLAELLAVGGVQVLCPGPLSESAVAQLICESWGGQADSPFVLACAKVSGGNRAGVCCGRPHSRTGRASRVGPVGTVGPGSGRSSARGGRVRRGQQIASGGDVDRADHRRRRRGGGCAGDR